MKPQTSPAHRTNRTQRARHALEPRGGPGHSSGQCGGVSPTRIAPASISNSIVSRDVVHQLQYASDGLPPSTRLTSHSKRTRHRAVDGAFAHYILHVSSAQTGWARFAMDRWLLTRLSTLKTLPSGSFSEPGDMGGDNGRPCSPLSQAWAATWFWPPCGLYTSASSSESSLRRRHTDPPRIPHTRWPQTGRHCTDRRARASLQGGTPPPPRSPGLVTLRPNRSIAR